MATGLVLTSVSLKRNNRLLFQPLTCEIQKGEILEIVGPNGVGKTSLLKILAGWIKPSQGRVGHPYQDSCLYFSLKDGFDDQGTVQENLDYLWILENKKGSFPTSFLDVFHLKNLRNRLLSQLSAGQRQRVHLTRLLLMTRQVWLLDEPFTSLDEVGCQALRLLCYRHQQQGGLIVVASPHSLNLGTRTIYLRPSLRTETLFQTDWSSL